MADQELINMLRVLNESVDNGTDSENKSKYKDKYYVEKSEDDGNYHIMDSETDKSIACYSEKSDADEECKKVNKSLKEAPESDKSNNKEEDSMKIKPAMGFERFLKLLFDEADLKVGRIALRKILSGKEDTLTLRERGTVAKSAMRLYPILAEDRVTFQRMEKALNSK